MSESEEWDLKAEDRELVQQLAQEYMEPALQLALKSADGKGTSLEILLYGQRLWLFWWIYLAIRLRRAREAMRTYRST